MNKEILKLLLEHPINLLNKDCIIDYFTKCKLNTIEELKDESNKLNTNVYVGKLLLVNNVISVITSVEDNSTFEYKELPNVKEEDMPFLNFNERLSIDSKYIENLSEAKSIITTLGRFLLNYTLLIVPFGDKIPYVNDQWNIRSIERKIVQLVIDDKTDIQSVKQYVNNIYFLSGYSEFVIPSISENAITVDPKVIALRNKLFKQYKDQLDDPEVMIKIENELIALDKEILSKDPNSGFLIENKNFATHRKRMFLMMGILPTFGDDSKQFNFSTTNLDDGWKKEDLDILFNDVRKGSYSRAKDTAKGGAESKYLGRSFQEARITEEDCGTKVGIKIHLTKNNIDSFLYRRILSQNKTPIIITKENKDKYINKTVILRSPMFCIAKHGYCYACLDSRYKKLEIRRLNIQPLTIGSVFLTNSMKKMHGSSVETFVIDIDTLSQASV